MDPRLDLITLAVGDLDAARRYYLDGLGWEAALDVPGEVLFVQLNQGLLAGFFGSADLAADIGIDPAAVLPGAGYALAHNVGSPAEVRAAVERAAAAGATVVKPPQDAAFGGYHAYVVDPVGIRWEFAWNPAWRVLPDGRVEIGAAPPVEDVDRPV